MSENEFTYDGFYQHLVQHRLMGSRCTAGGEIYLPPRAYCPHCRSRAMEWHEFSGNGTLRAFSIVYVGTTQMATAGFNRQNPYCVGIVQLEEGPSISALILGVDTARPETIPIGAQVKAEFVEIGSDTSSKTILAFRPL